MCDGDRHDEPRLLRRRDLLRLGAVAVGAGTLALPAWPSRAWAQEAPPAAVDVPPPTIVTRAEWGADESLGKSRRSFGEITRSFVHHSATGDEGAKTVREIHRFHTTGNGWDDIGYNFLVDGAGRVYEGRRARVYAEGEVHDGEDERGRGVVGAHASGYNTGSVGVVVLGNSSLADVSPAAMRSLAHVLAWKLGPRGLDPLGATGGIPNIAGHQAVVQTSCPGRNLAGRLPELRNLVADQLLRGVVGYRVLGADGSMWLYGASSTFRTTADIGDVRRDVRPGLPVRAAAGTPSGYGAWVADSGGAVYAFGDAAFHGSMGGTRLNRPVVGMAATPTGGGYWLVASDGGIFCFGDAPFLGSTGGMRLNQPIVGMAPTPSGRGYWLVASDGGIFSFGDARFFGSTGAIRLNQPITAMAPTPDGAGYWLLARDGGVFTFGNAAFAGSGVGRSGFTAPAAAVAAHPDGAGYWILDSAGAIHGFGGTPVFGGGVGTGSRPAVALVPVVRP